MQLYSYSAYAVIRIAPRFLKNMFIKPGRKTKEWEATKRKLKPAFEAVGLTYCEVGKYLMQIPEHSARVEKHRHWFFITWAHGDKRDNLIGDELITLVATACVDCHNYIEKMPREKMREIIEAVIAARVVQPKTYDN